MSKSIPIYPEKAITTVTVFLFKTKNEKEELVLGCVKKGKNTVFTLYIVYNAILHIVLSAILYLE